MIPPLQEIASSLRAAWRLFLLDGGAVAGFNRSIEGFWRSFFAAAFALPYYVLVLWEPYREGDIGFLRAAAYFVASWVVFPVVAALLTHLLQLGRNYITYIIALNWAGALVPQPLFLFSLAHRAGLIGEDAFSMVLLGFFIALLWYGWAIARLALGAGVITACGFVILSELLDMLVRALLLWGPQGPA